MRACAGDLAFHGALIARACVCVCVRACVRCQTPFSSRYELGQSLFLSTGKHLGSWPTTAILYWTYPDKLTNDPSFRANQK